MDTQPAGGNSTVGNGEPDGVIIDFPDPLHCFFLTICEVNTTVSLKVAFFDV